MISVVKRPLFQNPSSTSCGYRCTECDLDTVLKSSVGVSGSSLIYLLKKMRKLQLWEPIKVPELQEEDYRIKISCFLKKNLSGLLHGSYPWPRAEVARGLDEN